MGSTLFKILLLGALLFPGTAAHAVKPQAPVDITWSISGNVAPGDTPTVHISVTAVTDVDQLVVSVGAQGGLELAAPTPPVAFSTLHSGHKVEIAVPTRLQGRNASLKVVAKTVTVAGSLFRMITIPVGQNGVGTTQKPGTDRTPHLPAEDGLIHLPAERR